MSTTLNLLNLNVDTLFEQHSVAEIEIVQRKVQEVMEQKREELRQMVGESYRDLLQAADTICEMQQASSKLIEQVESISADCRSLNEQQLLGFETNDSVEFIRNRNANKQLNKYFSTMLQIKLLTSLPELIWSHVDQQQYYAATELFIFSRHISTGLQLDASNALMQQLPVAKKQWEILQPFHVTIKQNVLAALEREELSAETVVDCFLSLSLLEKNHLSAVFKTFLQLRSTAFLSCLTSNENGDEARRVKDRILASLKVLNSTIELTEKCFSENGMFFQKLADYCDANAPPTVALMDETDTQFTYMLPDIIANFRPAFEAQTLQRSHIQAALEQWLLDTKRIVGVHLKQLFNLVTTMSTIQSIKSAAHAYRKHANFALIAQQLNVMPTDLDFYEQHYVPLINQRVRDLIENSWRQAMHNVFEALEQALVTSSSTTHAPNILEEFVYDLPASLAEALNEDRKTKRLLMRTRGYDARILQICTKFDEELACIVSELNVLLEEAAAREADKLALIEFLRECAQTQLTDFIGKIKRLQLLQQQRGELLVVVRLCAALVELCPHLKICFCQQASWRQYVGNVPYSMESWQRSCRLLEEEMLNFWQLIMDDILQEYCCAQHMPLVIEYEVILADFALWETITLEQKDEQDQPLQSNIRIPNQPRISLQAYLFALIGVLNKSVPQTLPPKVLQIFNRKLMQQLATHYKSLAAHATTTDASQTVALQLFFDVKFLLTIFAIPREERALYDEFYALQNQFKDLIDPFDFELFAEHILLNVKRAVARLSCQFGVLAARSLTVVPPSVATQAQQDRDPNVLCLSASSTTSLWFPLLPIFTTNSVAGSVATSAAQESRAVPAAAQASKEQAASPARKTGSTRKSEAKQTKSGAASFFGAMSQEWFR